MNVPTMTHSQAAISDLNHALRDAEIRFARDLIARAKRLLPRVPEPQHSDLAGDVALLEVRVEQLEAGDEKFRPWVRESTAAVYESVQTLGGPQ